MRISDCITRASKIKQKHMVALIIKFPLKNNGLNYGAGGAVCVDIGVHLIWISLDMPH